MDTTVVQPFYQMPYQKQFYSDILEIHHVSQEYHVILTTTYFYYGSGGQAGDQGWIDGKPVIKTQLVEGQIVHVMTEPPTQQNNIFCEIDWARRYDGMVQHSAQHLISALFFTLYEQNTCSVHFGTEISTVDIEGTVAPEILPLIEEQANKFITENLEIQMYLMDHKSIQTRRKLPITDEPIRIVEIKNLDMTACSGIHLKSTLEIQVLRILKAERNKGNTRITFVAGGRAIHYFIQRDTIFEQLLTLYHCNEYTIANCINNLEEKIKMLSTKLQRLEKEHIQQEAKSLLEKSQQEGSTHKIVTYLGARDIKEIKLLIEALTATEHTIVILLFQEKEAIHIVSAQSEDKPYPSMKMLLSTIFQKYHGKGGGNELFAQGKFQMSIDMEDILLYAKQMII